MNEEDKGLDWNGYESFSFKQIKEIRDMNGKSTEKKSKKLAMKIKHKWTINLCLYLRKFEKKNKRNRKRRGLSN